MMSHGAMDRMPRVRIPTMALMSFSNSSTQERKHQVAGIPWALIGHSVKAAGNLIFFLPIILFFFLENGLILITVIFIIVTHWSEYLFSHFSISSLKRGHSMRFIMWIWEILQPSGHNLYIQLTDTMILRLVLVLSPTQYFSTLLWKLCIKWT